MSSRTQGILDRLSNAPKFGDVRWILGDGVLTNYMQSFVDETMQANAEFQSKAGVQPKIVRKSPGKCCPWCDALVGEYRYPDEVPKDVYKRHDNCNCIVEFYPGDGKKQDVWSKKWSDDAETIKARKTGGLEPPKAAQLEERKTIGLDEPNKLRDGIGAEHYNEMMKRASASSNETAKAVWEKMAPKVNVANAHYKGTAHAFGGSIFVDIEKNALGASYRLPYGTVFHESGHAIDSLAVHLAGEHTTGIWHLSSRYKNGAFRETIIKEANKRVDDKAKILKDIFKREDWETLHDMGLINEREWAYYQENGRFQFFRGKYSKSYAYGAVSKDIKKLGDIKGGDISDIMEGATSGRAHGSMGHGPTYWKKSKEMLPAEAFAEFTDATLNNPESLATIKEWFPESYGLYMEMLELIEKGM